MLWAYHPSLCLILTHINVAKRHQRHLPSISYVLCLANILCIYTPILNRVKANMSGNLPRVSFKMIINPSTQPKTYQLGMVITVHDGTHENVSLRKERIVISALQDKNALQQKQSCASTITHPKRFPIAGAKQSQMYCMYCICNQYIITQWFCWDCCGILSTVNMFDLCRWCCRVYL